MKQFLCRITNISLAAAAKVTRLCSVKSKKFIYALAETKTAS